MNTFIIAASYEEAARVAQQRGLHGNEWHLLTDFGATTLMGRSHPLILVTDCSRPTTMMSAMLAASHARVEYIQCP